MPGNERFKGKGFRMIQKRDPAKEAKRRQHLEDAQTVDRPIVLASRHNFVPQLSFSVPQNHDPILKAAQQILGAYSYSTFEGFCNPLFIEPLFSTDAVFIHQATCYGAAASAMYAVGRYGVMAKVHLFLNAINGQILVQAQQALLDLNDWIRTLPSPTRAPVGKGGYSLLRQWWAETGQAFLIMELPSELRAQILEHAFGFNIYPKKYYTSRGSRGSMMKFGNGTNGPGTGRAGRECGSGGTLRRVDAPTMGILTLNKKVHQEMQSYVENQTCKSFRDGEDYQEYLRKCNELVPSLPYQHIQYLELELRHEEYMHFFEARIVPFGRTSSRGVLVEHELHGECSTLLRLPVLKQLFLRFRAPIRKWDPWRDLGDLNGYNAGDYQRDWRGHQTRRWHEGHMSCQKILVDWILTYAFECLKQIPKVILCGYIKTSTKLKWDVMLKEARDGIEHDLSEAKLAIENWPEAELGPDCHCPKPCGERETFLGEDRRDEDEVKYFHKLKPLAFDYDDEGETMGAEDEGIIGAVVNW